MNEWSMEPKAFLGTLGIKGHTTDVAFTVGLDKAGHAEIEVGRLPLNKQTAFLTTYFDKEDGDKFSQFTLTGVDSDGAQFHCDSIMLTSLKHQSVLAEGSSASDIEPLFVCSMAPQACYSSARITMAALRGKDLESLASHEDATRPVLKWRVKGFDSWQFLSATCQLGVVEMAGGKDMNGKDELSGFLQVRAESVPADVEDWRVQADKLCTHVQHVMSFSAGAMLGAPLSEFHYRDAVVVDAYSNQGQPYSETPVFHYLNLQSIFGCAVKSHFEPAFEVKNINFAIQWFAMREHYTDSKLIAAMTVLENLLDSNLDDDDTKILSDKAFEKLRKRLSSVVKELAPEWSDNEDGQKAYIKELNERFSDLKRRSLMDKISLLAKRWGVDLSGIPEEFLQEAKRARDHVVHRGHHQPKAGSTRNLHDHVVAVREVVVRFILTALQFDGSYQSYFGVCHRRTFQKNAPDLGHIASSPVTLPQGQPK